MAANGRGYMRPNSAGRTPPFLIIGLLVVISILAFNYWSLSSKNNALTQEIDEVEMKYRSVQVRKLDVEKRNAELSSLLDEAKKYKQAAQEKDMKLREAEQKERELNAKIDNLAGEAEVLKNDLNTCDDEVGFCHENITKMIISHKKALEEAQMRCNMKVDEARSSAEQRAASVEKLDVQQSQQVQQPQLVLQQGQQQQQPLAEQQQQEQKQMPKEHLQPLQEQQKPSQEQLQQAQQLLQEQQLPQLQKVPREQQQQPHLPQEQQQPQLQQLPQEQQQPHEQQQLPHEQQQLQLQQLPHEQQQPQLQQPPKEQLPQDELQQQKQNMEGGLQQQLLPNVTKQIKDEQWEQKQEAKDINYNNKTAEVKESAVLQGLSQTNELAKAVQEASTDFKQQVAATQQQQQLQQQLQQQVSLGTLLPAAQSGEEQKRENVQAFVPHETKELLHGDDRQDRVAVPSEIRDRDNQPSPNEVAPAGHAVVQDSVHFAQEKEDIKDRAVDLNQRRDQAAYLANNAAPVGQAVGAELVVAAQQSLSPLSIQVLNEHYQLPAELDSNLRSELSKAEHDLKSQLAFSEEKLPLGSLKELLKSASQQSAINLRRFPADGQFAETDTLVTDTDTNHSAAHLSNMPSSFDANNLHDASSLSANPVDKNLFPGVLDKSAPSGQDQVELDLDEQEFGSFSMIEDSDSDHYEKAVSEILSKESLLDLPELDSALQKGDADSRKLIEEEGALPKEQVGTSGPKKTFSHGFLYLNLSQLLESSDLQDEFVDEGNSRREGDDDDDDDLFLDGTTNHYETTTNAGYSTEASDWTETTKPSMDFDAVNIQVDRFDNQEEAQGRIGDEESAGGQHLISGQLPKAVDSRQPYHTQEDQLRLPVNDNGQDENDEVLPHFHEYAEAGREQVNDLQRNDRDIEQIPQQGPLV